MLYRALITTHHMTSRKKITAISKAAKKYNCAVYLKTGAHGIGIAESEGEAGVRDWIKSVKVRVLVYSMFDEIYPRLCPPLSRPTYSIEAQRSQSHGTSTLKRSILDKNKPILPNTCSKAMPHLRLSVDTEYNCICILLMLYHIDLKIQRLQAPTLRRRRPRPTSRRAW